MVCPLTGMYTDGKGNYYERQSFTTEKINKNLFRVKELYFKKTKALVLKN